MTPRGARVLRAGLLGLLVLVLAAVGLSLRRPPAPDPPATVPGDAAGTTSTGLVLRSFRAGDERFVIEARSSQGQEAEGLRLQGVKVTFPYVSDGEKRSAVITADECLCEPVARKAAFRGNVKVVGDDGLELESEALDYSGEGGVAESDVEVRFKRGGLSGSGTGARYEAGAERLELRADVRLRIEEPGRPATDVQAGRGVADRRANTLLLSEGVVVRKGEDWLEASQLDLGFIGDFEVITRAVAKEDVRVRTADALVLPSTDASPLGRGGRRLECRKLDVLFWPDGALQSALAAGGRDSAGNPLYSDFEVLPGRRGPAERRRLQARLIVFRFDEAGRLIVLEGALGTILTAESTSPGGPPPRTIRSDSLSATLDPVSGALVKADLDGGVEFTQGVRRASARKGRYAAGEETLYLVGDARVADEERGSDLRAEAIDLGTVEERLSARGDVRHTLTRRGPAPRSGLLSRDEPAVFLARFLDYDGAARTARYRENALLRSGRDEVRAPLLVVSESASGERRLQGSGGVVSVLFPAPTPGQAEPPEPVETRSAEMEYAEAARRVTYTGDVEIRQGDIRTKSPEAVVTLGEDGSTVEKLVAGEPVEVEQGARKATGTTGTYTPRDETLVLVGEKVQLLDAERRVEGRVLTFRVGEDRIRVDGQEEVRTEAVFKREPPRAAPLPREPPKGEPPKR